MTENKDSKITLGSIASWILGSLFLLSGVASFADPDTAALAVIFLVIACMLFPPVRSFLYKKSGKSISTGVRIVAIIILLSMAGMSLPDSRSSTNTDFSTTSENSSLSNVGEVKKSGITKGLDVESFNFEAGEYGTQTITGILKNNSSKQYSYVQLEFNLYDGAGIQVGSTIANVNNLEPGASWKFNAPILDSEAVSAKLKGITSF